MAMPTIGSASQRFIRRHGCLFGIGCFLPLAGFTADSSAEAADLGPLPPALSESGKQFLSRVARRTIQDAALRREPYEPAYAPAELEAVSAEVVVRIRQRGFLLAGSSTGPATVVQATRDAALAAFRIWSADQLIALDDVNQWLIEIEVLGPRQPIIVSGDWTQPRVIDPFMEAGIHGVILRGPRGSRRFCPSETITGDRIIADQLRALAQSVLTDSTNVANTELSRFRSLHWYEPAAGEKIVTLRRGMTDVPLSAVTNESLAEAADRLAEYMCYRQRSSGDFAYLYEPSEDRYSDDDNSVRQAGAALGLAYYARAGGSDAARAAADRSLRRRLEGLTSIPQTENAAFVATPDRLNKLGVTALVCSAMSYHPDADRFREVRQKLVNGMLWLQRPAGIFLTSFPPADEVDAQDYFPGEALLALALAYDKAPSAQILEAFDRAANFYRGYFQEGPSPAFVPWQVQAFSIMARKTKRQDYADFVFQLSDWLAATQLDETTTPWPDLVGGFAPYQPGHAGVASASYLEGFADALALARWAGDTTRAADYERIVRRAARFVLQLQVRPEEAYFMRSPRDAVWGIRTTPALHLLRIDHCQHALVALAKTRRVLFTDPE
jgi:hypothetical protein